MKIHPGLIGIIGAALMIPALLAGYYETIASPETAQLAAYGSYAAAVFTTLLLHGKPSMGFGGNFLQGFRCFIVITLVMVLFTYLFNYLHPETAQLAAAQQRTSLLQLNNRTPAEIEQEVKLFEKGFTTMVVSRAIFGYLVFGALLTAVGSFIQTLRKP